MTTAAANLIQFAATGSPCAPLPVFTTNTEQQRFMWLHQRHLVIRWQWMMRGSQMRAFADNGMTATIGKDSLAQLVAEGFMKASYPGEGYMYELTEMGKAQ